MTLIEAEGIGRRGQAHGLKLAAISRLPCRPGRGKESGLAAGRDEDMSADKVTLRLLDGTTAQRFQKPLNPFKEGYDKDN